MARRQDDDLDSPAIEHRIGADEEGIEALTRKRCESRIDFAASAGVEDVKLQPHSLGSRFYISQRGRRGRYIGWIDEHGHTRCAGHQRMQQFQSLCYQLVNEKIDTRRVSAGPGEAGDETKSDPVFASGKDDGAL